VRHTASASAAKAGPAAAERKAVLLGDSVLDNFYWLQTPKRHLRVQLEEALQACGTGLRCVSLAVDQMTTFDFEERTAAANPWEGFARARRQVGFEEEQDVEYRVDQDGVIRSAKSLAKLDGVEWNILSIGGNDVYLNRGVQADLLLSLLPPFAGRRKEVAGSFGQRFRRVLASVRRAAPDAKLVLVIPYRPHRDFSLVMGAPINDEGQRISGDLLGDFVRGLERQYLSELVNPMVIEILRAAQEEGCPVVDLSKTFDPTNEEHYGTGRMGAVNALGVTWSGAEPSDASTGFTAKLFAHVLQQPPAAVVYRGVPRKEGPNWSVLVKEENNDAIFLEDYSFGPGSRRREAGAEEGGGELVAFAVGVFITVLLNAASLVQGGDVLFFDRGAFEAELQQQIAQESGQGGGEVAPTAAASSTAAGGG